MKENRTASFMRNERLEDFLKDLNKNLEKSELELINYYMNHSIHFPLVLILGPLRSGTTLFMQWLANLGSFSYPTNLLSRFYNAPIIGARIQLLLTDPRYNFRNELGEFISSPDYNSQNGKTVGALAPNEFWYFWRRFLADPNRDVWSNQELRDSFDILTLRAELNGIMNVFQKPFAAKAMLFNYNIPYLDSVFEKLLIIQIKRDPISNIESVLDARKRQLGDVSQWYSFKIPEYEKLKKLDPITQAAGQVHYINQVIDKDLAKVDDSRKLIVQYEDFCDDPCKFYKALSHKLQLDFPEYQGPKKFEITRRNSQANKDIMRAIKHFES